MNILKKYICMAEKLIIRREDGYCGLGHLF